jgi:hypothetical protein
VKPSYDDWYELDQNGKYLLVTTHQKEIRVSCNEKLSIAYTAGKIRVKAGVKKKSTPHHSAHEHPKYTRYVLHSTDRRNVEPDDGQRAEVIRANQFINNSHWINHDMYHHRTRTVLNHLHRKKKNHAIN